MVSVIIGKKLSGKTYTIKEFLAKSKKAAVIIDPNAEYDVPRRFMAMIDFENAILNKEPLPNRIAFSLPGAEEGEDIFAWCWNLRPHILIIDEFHLYSNPWSMPKSLQRIFRMGRHRGIDVIGVTHRFVDLNQIIITQCDGLVMFRQQGIRDIEAIEKVTDLSTAERVNQLRDHEKIEYRF